ncbi:MAG: hypothetical protein MI861_11505, partial [Pirellulales bacterium]|nr:hypothetical protein [Pirellulales bacterium]
YPDRPGQLELGEIRIAVDYPQSVNRSGSSSFGLLGGDLDQLMGFGDSPFGRRWRVTSSRPVQQTGSFDPVDIKPVPMAGRPDNYRGAVGQYKIVTEASPLQTKVGEPVELRIGIAGTGPMDLVLAPPLAKQSDLVADFKVDSGELPGFVSNNIKQFNTTIRPRHTGVSQVPAIQFSYFDPDQEQFCSISSDPIAIEVDPSETLSMDSILGGKSAPRTATESDARQPTPAFELVEADLLRSEPSYQAFSPLAVGGLFVPPVLFLLAAVGANRTRFASLLGRITPARRRFQQELDRVNSIADLDQTLQRFLRRRWKLDQSPRTRSLAVGKLRGMGASDLAIALERFFAECDKEVGSGRTMQDEAMEELKSRAKGLVDQVTGLPSRMSKVRRRAKVSTAGILLMVVFPTVAHGSSAAKVEPHADEVAATALSLSLPQQQALLDEAVLLWRQAQRQADREASKRLYRQAAQKYDQVVQSGVRNRWLYYNLAICQLQAEQVGYAVANFRRALRLEPTNPMIRAGLEQAQRQKAGRSASTPAMLGNQLRSWNLRWHQFVAPRANVVIACGCWLAFWCVLALRACGLRFVWKSTATALALLGCLVGLSYGEPITHFTSANQAVLTEPQVPIRQTDDPKAEVVTRLENAEGSLVRVLDQRDGWLKIQVDEQTAGWVPNQTAARI